MTRIVVDPQSTRDYSIHLLIDLMSRESSQVEFWTVVKNVLQFARCSGGFYISYFRDRLFNIIKVQFASN